MRKDDVDRIKIEYNRIKKLSEFDLDYGNLQEEFKSLVELAAHVAGTEVSLINLIDNHSQWSVSRYNADIFQMDREASICQYTIQTENLMEVPHLDQDERFSEHPFVKGEDGFRFYLGIPLKVQTGENIGALCVLDQEEKKVSAESKRLLELIADEIVKKLECKIKMDSLQDEFDKAIVQRNQLAHDVRGPVGGILGLAMSTENVTVDKEEFKSYMEMIKGSASKLLDLTDDILEREKALQKDNYFTLSEFKAHLEDLYALPAHNKEVNLQVAFNQTKDHQRFSRRKLLPIVGNLIANAVKFTPSKGEVKVNLDIVQDEEMTALRIEVSDNGKGIPKEKLQNITDIGLEDDRGTADEKGYGMGLSLVAEMVESIHGILNIESEEGRGTNIKIAIPLNLN